MKVVYFGSDVFLSCFEYFVQSHQILALYTYHNEEDYFTEFSIVNRAEQLHIPVYYQAITPEQICDYICKDGCDLFFVAEYNRILPIPEDLTEFRGLNIHSSHLPQGRSYYPIEAAMERNLPTTGVTIHKLIPKLDQGDILAQRRIAITADMDSIDIYLHCAAHAREMLEQLIPHFDQYWTSAQPQGSVCPYWKRPDARLLTLRHEMTRKQALELFGSYNAMTQVWIHETWYHVTALTAGVGPMDQQLRFLSPDRVLYQVRDGHLRLHIHRMEGSI